MTTTAAHRQFPLLLIIIQLSIIITTIIVLLILFLPPQIPLNSNPSPVPSLDLYNNTASPQHLSTPPAVKCHLLLHNPHPRESPRRRQIRSLRTFLNRARTCVKRNQTATSRQPSAPDPALPRPRTRSVRPPSLPQALHARGAPRRCASCTRVTPLPSSLPVATAD